MNFRTSNSKHCFYRWLPIQSQLFSKWHHLSQYQKLDFLVLNLDAQCPFNGNNINLEEFVLHIALRLLQKCTYF